jgi:hypothetical protein
VYLPLHVTDFKSALWYSQQSATTRPPPPAIDASCKLHQHQPLLARFHHMDKHVVICGHVSKVLPTFALSLNICCFESESEFIVDGVPEPLRDCW